MRLDAVVPALHQDDFSSVDLTNIGANSIMIENPDQEPERWDEPIVAVNPKDAKKECQKRADRYDVELESVTEPRHIQNRPQVYRCNYKEKI